MRVLGNSTSNPNKFIVEVSQRELEVFKGMCAPQNPCGPSFNAGMSPVNKKQMEGRQNRGEQEEVEEKVFTTDEILDSYLAKKISKDELAAMMNEARRS